MKRSISKTDLESYISTNFNSKVEFANKLKISYSHLDKLLKNKVCLGEKVFKRLEIIMGDEIESVLKPLPILINSNEIEEIQILKEDELIASICSSNIIEKTGYKVVCVPKVNN